jgi:CRP-like cAMP-binding protein
VGRRAAGERGPGGNRILNLLDEDDRERVLHTGRLVELEPGDTLHEPGDDIGYVYFPFSGVLSILAVLSTGEAIEAATVGREGMAGLPVFLGSRQAPTRTAVQVGGVALALDAAAFRAELGRDGGRLAVAMARYAEIMFMSAAQGIACNRVHTLSSRLARAILTWHDRMASEILPVTQDALAEALGVRRAGVTAAISEFVRRGAIRRGRGRLYLGRREELEAEACECYALLTDAYNRPIG